MLLEVLTKDDWTHLDDGRVRKQSTKAMENQRQETEVAANTMSPAMVVHDALFRQAMSLISKTECSVKEAEIWQYKKCNPFFQFSMTEVSTNLFHKHCWENMVVLVYKEATREARSTSFHAISA